MCRYAGILVDTRKTVKTVSFWGKRRAVAGSLGGALPQKGHSADATSAGPALGVGLFHHDFEGVEHSVLKASRKSAPSKEFYSI